VAPGSGTSFDTTLRAAPLRVMSDAECTRKYRRARGNDGERFDARRMVCGIDIDGRSPLSSGCNGDSGGPLYSGTRATPVVHGVVSFGGLRCGADRLPSVFTEVSRYRAFVLDPTPAWAPSTRGSARIAGGRRAGARLACTAPRFENGPVRIATHWLRVDRGRQRIVARGRTYIIRRADRGHRVNCRVVGSNAGGYATTIARGVLVRR
jgi:hypothetical protein